MGIGVNQYSPNICYLIACMEIDNLIIGIIDDQPLEGFGLKTFLNNYLRTAEVTILGDGPNLPVDLRKRKYDVILICTNQRAASNEWLYNHFTQDSKPALVILSGIEDIHDCVAYMSWGVKGYIGKQARQEHIAEAIQQAAKGGGRCVVRINCLLAPINYKLMNVSPQRGHSPDSSLLSSREFEIACKLADGERTKSIAASLHLKQSTVSTFKKNIFNKLRVTNIVELHNVLILERKF